MLSSRLNCVAILVYSVIGMFFHLHGSRGRNQRMMDFWHVLVYKCCLVRIQRCRWASPCPLCAGARVACGQASTASIVLQLSDVHTSVHQHIRSHRERHEELQIFSTLVAPHLGAAAAVITGDLVDSKSADNMFPFQYEWEWKAYRNVTEVLMRSLRPSLQVRGPLAPSGTTTPIGPPSSRPVYKTNAIEYQSCHRNVSHRRVPAGPCRRPRKSR